MGYYHKGYGVHAGPARLYKANGYRRLLMLWAGAERLVDVLLGYSIATLGVLRPPTSCACECKLLSRGGSTSRPV